MKILIVSASKGNNFSLGQQLGNRLNVEHEIISLEDYPLPLFIPGGEKPEEQVINDLVSKFDTANGFIFCAPEYNAGLPPILTNAITWITVSTQNWRDAFNNKVALIGTHSGGSAFWFLSSFRDQLEYMGCTVYHRNISIHKNAAFNPESVDKILTGFKNIIA